MQVVELLDDSCADGPVAVESFGAVCDAGHELTEGDERGLVRRHGRRQRPSRCTHGIPFNGMNIPLTDINKR
jgi:hypothetical protein